MTGGAGELETRRLPVGLIGCGWISRIAHLPNLLASPRARVVGLSDLSDENRAHAMRLCPGARAYRAADGLLADDAVEAVVIATPPRAAADIAAAAFAAGKHVYLEKPGAATPEQAVQVRAAWQASGRIGVVGYNFRLNPAVEAARSAIRSGLLGDSVTIQGVFTWSPGGSGWRDEADSGGALMDLGCHHIDLAVHLAGSEVIEAQAVLRSLARLEDTADLRLRFANGGLASLHVSSGEGRNANALRLFAQNGHMELDLVRQNRPRLLRGDPPRTRLGRARELIRGLDPVSLAASGAERSFARLLDTFLSDCLQNVQSRPSIDDALAVLRTVEMARGPVPRASS